jgi:hypothetical protein
MEKEKQILNLYPIDYPFETLVSRATSEPPKLILNPDFQRKYKWDKDGNLRASRFIESCLMRIPIPACYFAENENNFHNVIDGVQRITTIKKFFNDEFALEGLTIYPELNGKKFSELEDFKSTLESTTIRCIVLRKENPKELVHEIFARLNQGAVKLKDQEIRHAIYPGVFDNLLTELGEIPFIANFRNSKSKDDRSNEELVLRFFALDNDLNDYDSKLSEYLDMYMSDKQNIELDVAEQMRNEFTSTLAKCLRTFEKPFVDTTLDKPRQSVAYYDLIMHSFKNLSDEYVDSNKECLNQKFEELCCLEEFQKTLSGGLQQKVSIIKRRELWQQKINEINEN